MFSNEIGGMEPDFLRQPTASRPNDQPTTNQPTPSPTEALTNFSHEHPRVGSNPETAGCLIHNRALWTWA